MIFIPFLKKERGKGTKFKLEHTFIRSFTEEV